MIFYSRDATLIKQLKSSKSFFFSFTFFVFVLFALQQSEITLCVWFCWLENKRIHSKAKNFWIDQTAELVMSVCWARSLNNNNILSNQLWSYANELSCYVACTDSYRHSSGLLSTLNNLLKISSYDHIDVVVKTHQNTKSFQRNLCFSKFAWTHL